MIKTNALIFGKNDYALEIQKSIDKQYKTITILELLGEDGFDLSDDWEALRDKIETKNSIAFCVLEDIAQNIFLTISLRDTFPNLTIVSLGSDIESSNKLKMAGASRVISVSQATANAISGLLEKPISAQVFYDNLDFDKSLKIAHIEIKNHKIFTKYYLQDINWSEDYKIIVISITHSDGSSDFIYSSKVKNYTIKSNDTLVVAGYENDIKEFRKLMGIKCDG